ncbi:MAG: hypothetical protein WDA74_04225, partial [Spirochaetota bacterium]
MNETWIISSVIVILCLLVIPSIAFAFINYQKLKKLEEGKNSEVLLNLVNSLKQDISDTSHKSRMEFQQKLDSITSFLNRSQLESSQ